MSPEQKKIVIRKMVNDPLQLTPIQKTYFNLMKKGEFCLARLLEFCHQTGEPIVFHELWKLLIKLDHTHLLESPQLSEWQGSHFDLKMTYLSDQHQGGAEKVTPQELKGLPFFRSFGENLLQVFSELSSVHRIEIGTILCQQGGLDRSLFVILDGQASVYRNFDSKGERMLIARCERGSVVGEVGFFLGEKRTANVIMTQAGKVIRFLFHDKLNEIINFGAMKQLQERLFFLQALLKSHLFRNLADQTVNSLLMIGKMIHFSENEVLFKEGDRGDSLYIIVQGSIVISQKSQTINVLNQGAVLGEVAFLTKEQVRTASARAQSDGLLMKIPYGRLLELIFNNITLGYIIEKQALERMNKDFQRD